MKKFNSGSKKVNDYFNELHTRQDEWLDNPSEFMTYDVVGFLNLSITAKHFFLGITQVQQLCVYVCLCDYSHTL